MNITTRTMELSGSSYEIGRKLGEMTASIPPLKDLHTSGFEGFDKVEIEKAMTMFSRWCPGLNDELQGFADALQVPLERIFYYGMTYLHPNCSQIAALPSLTRDGHPLIARNYEFNTEEEDFTLVKTSVTGKYTHMGTSVLHFGRDDGFNECGLSVTMSSSTFPVGSMEYMRQPKVTGLQFWAVIRTLLENCVDVEDALLFMKEMPIAFNINLMLVDKQGNAALVETVDGHREIKRVFDDGTNQGERYLCATNHPVLPGMIPYEPRALSHSIKRYQWIRKELEGFHEITCEKLKNMLLSKYPNGLCCHFYREYFGTTKSMVIDPVDGTIELCWGGRVENGWDKYSISDPLPFKEKQIEIRFDSFDAKESEYVPLEMKQ